MAFILVIIIHFKILICLVDGVISEMAKEVIEIGFIWPLEIFIKTTLLYVAKRTMPSL
jgi:hypothetical protein